MSARPDPILCIPRMRAFPIAPVPRIRLLCIVLLLALVGSPAGAQTEVGPARGALVVAGGGRLGPEIMARFVALAGGENARIVVIPTAGEQDEFPADWGGTELLRTAGAREVTVLHTRDRAVANSDAFVAPLRAATGVWIPGGRQWRLADAYLGTRTLEELNALLARGGVIGGTSAGASIQASYMVRGAVEGNTIMMAPGHEDGFGFLRNTAVDQHLLARGREEDLLEVIAAHPSLLGIGLDEGTAIVVEGDRAEVIGRSRAAFYNARDAAGARYYFLEPGGVFDLAGRRAVTGDRIPAASVQEREIVQVVQRLFDAMRQADTASIRALHHPDARVFTAPMAAAGALRVMDVDGFVRSIAASQARADERMAEPEVRVDGDIATVWTYYDFFSGETFSHCGTDAVQLGRDAGTWKILQITWNLKREGCRR
jgi:cyanophycinase